MPLLRTLPHLALCAACLLAAPPAQHPGIPGLPGAQGKGAAPQKEKELPPPLPLGKGATETLCASYAATENWVQKAVILLSLNQWWHPAGVEMILAGLRDKDERLRAFALEALLRSDPQLLPAVGSIELVDELVGRQIGDRNDLYGQRVAAALTAIAPGAAVENRRDWARWWRENKETWQPAAWQAKEQPAAHEGSGTSAASQRALDIYQYGLDLMICIDSTGSMQPTIDALAEALGNMVAILDGLSPKMRLGVIHYKDHGDLGKEGAKLLSPLNKNVAAAKKELEKLTASGGGDLPEAVRGGLELAYDRQQKWNKDANKVVVLIGDAPPHAADAGQAVELARHAFASPGGLSSRPTTGLATGERGIITSAIGVVLDVKGGEVPQEFTDSQRQMREDFEAIAKAGGGFYVDVVFKVRIGPPPTSKEREAAKANEGRQTGAATRRIVESILVLSFGERYAREMRDFARIFYDYKDAGLFK